MKRYFLNRIPVFLHGSPKKTAIFTLIELLLIIAIITILQNGLVS